MQNSHETISFLREEYMDRIKLVCFKYGEEFLNEFDVFKEAMDVFEGRIVPSELFLKKLSNDLELIFPNDVFKVRDVITISDDEEENSLEGCSMKKNAANGETTKIPLLSFTESFQQKDFKKKSQPIKISKSLEATTTSLNVNNNNDLNNDSIGTYRLKNINHIVPASAYTKPSKTKVIQYLTVPYKYDIHKTEKVNQKNESEKLEKVKKRVMEKIFNKSPYRAD